MIYITRKVHFNAAHRMHNPSWDEAKNKEVFGPCNNPNGHGHNYELEITICGEPNPETGYIIDLRDLNTIIEQKILAQVDHRHLNHDVPFMQGIIPSSENFAMAIWQQLEAALPTGRLYAVRLYETPRNYVEIRK